tara:strand:- start:1603 stop:2826 length:1224 start_codon:yes stop_codon:yes gene_type:complete
MNKFDKFALNRQIIKALNHAKFHEPTNIQTKVIPLIAKKIDVLGVAQTGTGKTAAYVIPILQNLTQDNSKYKEKSCKTIVIVPTRELAMQVYDTVKIFCKFLSIRTSLVVGGVKPKPQLKSIYKGVDILVGTPGRVMDHIRSGGLILKSTKTIILDEADQLMDLGFIPDIKKMYKMLPEAKQTIFITATMLKPVKEIALQFLNNYTEVNLSPKVQPIEKIKQKMLFLNKESKLEKLKYIIEREQIYQAIIFTRTKKRADNLAKSLNKNNFNSMSFHGDKRQAQRTRILNSFKIKKLNFLIATDVAARGIDIDNVMFIINYDLPTKPEIYVHRIGRTARAGKEGTAISLYDESEIKWLKQIEKLIGFSFNLNMPLNKNNKRKKSKNDNRTKKKVKTKSIKKKASKNKK